MVNIGKRRGVKKVLVLLGSAFWVSWVMAQDKPLTLMVPFPPGGISDAAARAVVPSLSKRLGRVVIVENLGGVGGALAAQKVLNAPADGNYIFVGSPTELILTPLANSAVKYKSENFSALSMMGDLQFAIIGRGNLPAENIDELLVLAAQAAKKGEPMSYGSVGYGSIFHLMGELLSQQTGTPMTHIAYKGGGPMFQDLAGGQIDLFIGNYLKSHLEMEKLGRLKFFASMTEKRAEEISHVQTVQESKYLKNFIHSLWLGFFVKKDTPAAVAQTLHQALSETLKESAVMESLKSQSIVLRKSQSTQEADATYAAETARFRAFAKSINLKPQ